MIICFYLVNFLEDFENGQKAKIQKFHFEKSFLNLFLKMVKKAKNEEKNPVGDLILITFIPTY